MARRAPARDRTRPVLLASDVDGTFWSDGVSLRALREAYESRPAGVDVLLVSSRSVPELAELTRAIGAPSEFIAENGAVIVTSDLATALHLRGARGEAMGDGYAYVAAEPASPLMLAAHVREARRQHQAPVRLVEELTAAERRTLLGDEATVRGASTRRASVLALADWGAMRTARWAAALRARGVRVANGGRWTLAWEGPDKGEALQRYLAARAAARGAPALVAAVGDAANDLSLLDAAERRFAMPREDGRVDPALRAVADLEVAPRAGTDGWRAVAQAVGRPR